MTTDQQIAEQIQRPWAYWEDDKLIVRAFAFGDCIAGLVASALGEGAFPPGAFVRNAMDISGSLESLALAEYRNRTAHKVIWQQKQLELDLGEVVVRGHPDGLDQEDDDLLEVKWLSARNFDLYNKGGLESLGKLGVKYRWQTAVYAYAAERDVRFVIGNKGAMVEEEGTLRPPKNDDEWLIIEPPVPPQQLVPLPEIEERAMQILEGARTDVIPDCDRGCGKNEAFAHVHIFEAVKMGDLELEAKLARIVALDKVIKALTGDAKNEELLEALSVTIPPGPTLSKLKDDVKKEFGEGTHVAGRYKAVVSPMGGTQFQTASFRKEYPELHEEFSVPRGGSKITVTHVGNGEE